MAKGGIDMGKKEELDDDTILWRYMNLESFLSFIICKELSFCRLDKLRNIDEYEGTSSRSELEKFDVLTKVLNAIGEKADNGLLKEESLIKQLLKSGLEESNKMYYVNGWHINATESVAMWDSFTKLDTGIAIKTTFGKIKKWIENVKINKNYDIKHGIVAYNGSNEASDNNCTLLRKEKYFIHENELRLYFQFNDDSKNTVTNEFHNGISIGKNCLDNPERISISITDIGEVVDEIIINPKAEKWYIILIKRLLADYNVKIIPRISDIKFKEIEIDPNNYKLIDFQDEIIEILKNSSFGHLLKNS